MKTKQSTPLDNKIRCMIIKKKKDNPKMTYKEIVQWLQGEKIYTTESTVSRTLQKENEIMSDNPEQKRKRKVTRPNFDEEVFKQFLLLSEKGCVSDQALIEIARQEAIKLNVTDLQFSNGWLASFKSRYSIKKNH